jgi:hypothetical protein
MSRKKAKHTPKRVLRLPDLDFAKSAVLNTLRIVSAEALVPVRDEVFQVPTFRSEAIRLCYIVPI